MILLFLQKNEKLVKVEQKSDADYRKIVKNNPQN